MSATLDELSEVFRRVFEDPALRLTRATTAADVEGWDSLMHVTLLINVERSCGVKFTSAQVAGLKNVGELVDLVERLRARKAT